MKHILNNLSEQEKNAIREQHTGGMKVMTENFSRLLNSKLGDSKPLVNEQEEQTATRLGAGIFSGGISELPTLINGSGSSGEKVKSMCDACDKSKVQISQQSNEMADVIRDAVNGLGTDEDAIFGVFKSLRTIEDFCALSKSYVQSYNVNLYSDLADDISQESEWINIFRPLRDLVLKSQQLQKPGVRPTAGAKPTNPTFGAKPTNPTFGAKPTNPTFGAKPTNPTFGAKPTAVPTKQPKFTSK